MSWEIKPLADVIELRRGFDLPSGDRVAGDYPVISAGKQIGTHHEAKVDGPGFAVGRATNLGVPQWSDNDYWPLNTTLYAADFKGNSPRWLFHLFQILDLTGFNSGSVQPMLNRNYIAQVQVSVPPRRVQDAISEVLGALDDKIAANRAAISTGQKLMQAQWEQLSSTADGVRDLNDVVDLNPRTPLPAEGPHPFLDMKELPQNGLLVDRWSERESRSGSKFRNGDTLLARITPCFENGKAGLVDFLPLQVAGLGSTEYIVLRPKDRVPQAVPYCIATSGSFRSHAARGMTGTSGRQRVQASNIGDYPVGWPGQDALDRFGGFTDALIRRLSAARNENTLLSRTRDELLPLLMGGRITVKDAERIAADVL